MIKSNKLLGMHTRHVEEIEIMIILHLEDMMTDYPRGTGTINSTHRNHVKDMLLRHVTKIATINRIIPAE